MWPSYDFYIAFETLHKRRMYDAVTLRRILAKDPYVSSLPVSYLTVPSVYNPTCACRSMHLPMQISRHKGNTNGRTLHTISITTRHVTICYSDTVKTLGFWRESMKRCTAESGWHLSRVDMSAFQTTSGFIRWLDAELVYKNTYL